MVSEVLGEVQLVHERVKIFFSEKHINNENSSIFLKYQPNISFPINSIEEMEQFEEFMKNEKDFSEAVSSISTIMSDFCQFYILIAVSGR